VGSFAETDKNFKTSCNGQAMTHKNAKVKRYHHVFRWQAPPVGSGDVIFRVIVKVGSTNGGWFYWPMKSGDLMLYERSEPIATYTQWYIGDIGETCSETCAKLNKKCDDTAVLNSTLHIYDDIKSTQSCKMPLISDCSVAVPSRDSDGFCYIQDDSDADGPCSSAQDPVTRICDTVGGVQNEFASETMCPCEDLSSTAPPDQGDEEETSPTVPSDEGDEEESPTIISDAGKDNGEVDASDIFANDSAQNDLMPMIIVIVIAVFVLSSAVGFFVYCSKRYRRFFPPPMDSDVTFSVTPVCPTEGVQITLGAVEKPPLPPRRIPPPPPKWQAPPIGKLPPPPPKNISMKNLSPRTRYLNHIWQSN